MPESRRIENYGILKLLPEERGANNLLITSDVIQLPYSEYVNAKTNPFRGHYGYVCFMSGEYVIHDLDIQFRRQIILDRDRYIVQLAWQESCNSATIRDVLGIPLPDTEVDYPIWICDELRFKLEPGVVINVFKSHIPPVTCPGTLIVEPDMIPEPPGLPQSPQAPPPKGTPNQALLPLSPPYEGDDDNGNTYVRTGQAVYTKFWLSGTYLDGNGNYQQQSSEPQDSTAYILVAGRGEGISLQQAAQTTPGPDGQPTYLYKLSTGEQFNGGWKPSPSLASRVITQ